MKWWLAFLATCALAHATSCFPYRPICHRLGSFQTVFLGTILAEPEKGRFLVRVDEAFKGLAPSTPSVFLQYDPYPGSVTDPGLFGQHVLFAFNAKPIDGLRPTLIAEPCGRSSANDPDVRQDVAWLRDWVRGKTSTKASGFVVQRYAENLPLRPEVDVPLAGVKLSLVSKSGQRFETLTQPDGSYSLNGIPPGQYEISASKPPWTPSRQMIAEIGPGTCSFEILTMLSQNTASGQVLGPNGKPAINEFVGAFRLRADGKLASQPMVDTTTDGEGRFLLSNIPSGYAVIATQSQGRTNRLHFQAKTGIKGITLRLR